MASAIQPNKLHLATRWIKFVREICFRLKSQQSCVATLLNDPTSSSTDAILDRRNVPQSCHTLTSCAAGTSISAALPQCELRCVENCCSWPMFCVCKSVRPTRTRPTCNHTRNCSKLQGSKENMGDGWKVFHILRIGCWQRTCRTLSACRPCVESVSQDLVSFR